LLGKKTKEEEEKKMEDTKEEILVLYGTKWPPSISSLTVPFYPAYLPMPLLSWL
jgi:hypothetical protein